jgi:hypothetical protein
MSAPNCPSSGCAQIYIINEKRIEMTSKFTFKCQDGDFSSEDAHARI